MSKHSLLHTLLWSLLPLLLIFLSYASYICNPDTVYIWPSLLNSEEYKWIHAWFCHSIQPLILILVCTLYFGCLLAARYLWLVMPNNHFLRIYEDEIKAQMRVEQKNPAVTTKMESEISDAIKDLLKDVDKRIPEKTSWRCWVLGGTGKQLACWRNVHKAKILAIELLSEADVRALIAVISIKLKQIDTESKRICSSLSKLIDDEINKTDCDVELLKSLAKQGQELLFDERDNYFEGLANLQNRATWLAMVSLLILVILGVANGNIILFTLGAVGGLLSRMRQILARREHAFDYGASWSTLFLTPIVGALTGWSGVLLVLALLEADILGPTIGGLFFDDVLGMKWDEITPTKEIMALALAFGFSASLFEDVMEKIKIKKRDDSLEIV